MENRFSDAQPASSKISAPWMAFYLASTLGLMLGALNYSPAEPVAEIAGNQPGRLESVSVQHTPENQLPAPSAQEANETGQVSIPGIQSAVLTVGKEIQTNVELVNRTQPAATTKKQVATPVASSSDVGHRYFLQLPEPKSSAQSSPSVVKDAIPATAATVPIAIPTTEGSMTQQSAPEQPAFNLIPQENPEAQPLDLSADNSPVSGAATNAMIRITLGLMAVLSMLMVLAKVVVPRLMARHPEFFENLKRKNQPKQEQRPLDIPKTVAEKLAEQKTPQKLSLFGSRKKPVKKQESKTTPPERLELNGQQFNVLSSTQLGKDKDLHLVEIMGRQLVVATTPYTVSLIQDLTGAEQQTSQQTATVSMSEMANPLEAAIDPPIAQLNLLTSMAETGQPATDETEEMNAAMSGSELSASAQMDDSDNEDEDENYDFAQSLDMLIPQPDRIIVVEDLDDQPPMIASVEEMDFIRPKSNSYASAPRILELVRQDEMDGGTSMFEQTELEPAYAIAGLAQEETLSSEHAEPVHDSADLKVLSIDEESKQETTSTTSAYPTLEEVIIMNDYDDVYGC